MYHNWLNRSTNAAIAANSQYARLSFSQHGEDMVLWTIFGGTNPTPGVYIDIGCYHPHLYSNTKVLSLIGWSGVAIDANPELGKFWIADRPSDLFENIGIADQPGMVEFFMFADGAVNTFDRKAAEELIAKGWRLVRTVAVETQPLSDVLRRHGVQIHHRFESNTPTFLNIDIEGNDTSAILSTKFTNDTFRPSAMCVEFWGDLFTIDNPVRLHLEAQGYALIAVMGPSMIFRRCAS